MDTRARILGEATRQLCDRGYADFTLASVRDAVGVSNGSLFHAFPSRAALAAAAWVDGMVDYQRTALRAVDGEDDPEKALRALIEVHLAWVETHRDLARFLFATLPDDVMAEAAAPLASHNARFFAVLDDFYRSLAKAGLSAPMQRTVAHSLAIGPAQEYCRLWVRGLAGPRPTRLTPTFQAAALAALGTSRHPPARRRGKRAR